MATKHSEIIDQVDGLLAVSKPEQHGAIVRGNSPVTIVEILNNAIEKGVPPESLERIMALYERNAAYTAKQEFAAAKAAFAAACPPIPRRTENQQFTVTRDGIKRARCYASLEDIAATIRKPLSDHGLSFSWGDAVIDKGMMTLTCRVSHIGGHSESSSVTMPVESKAGCSDQQKFGSAGTYAQRYSLIQALGLTSCDEDDDGNGSADERITESQAANIDAMIDDVGADRPKFLKFLGVEKISEIPASEFKRAIAALESKRKAGK